MKTFTYRFMIDGSQLNITRQIRLFDVGFKIKLIIIFKNSSNIKEFPRIHLNCLSQIIGHWQKLFIDVIVWMYYFHNAYALFKM